MLPYINICGRIIGSYAICAMIGAFIAVFVSTKLLKPYGIAFEDIILCTLVLSCGVIVGGHLLYAITSIDEIASLIDRSIKAISYKESIAFSDILSTLSKAFGGMVYYGGFIGATSALFIYIKQKGTVLSQTTTETITDVFAICVPLFHTFGRIGCFLGGCCYGIESAIGFTAHDSIVPELNGVKRFPVALLESLFNLILFFVLLYLFKRRSANGCTISEKSEADLHCFEIKCSPKGRLIFLYMMIYPAGRFFIEFLRGDTIRGSLFGISTSQIISIALMIFGTFMYIRKGKKEVLSPDHNI